MDPYEQRLRDEVIYLHSLWHQGPPRNLNPVPVPVPVPPTFQPRFPLQHCSSSPTNAHRMNLHISNPTPFKRKFGAKRNKRGLMGKDDFLAAASGTSDGGAEWPIPKTMVEPSPGFSEWPRAKPVASRTMPAAEETARLAVLQKQHRVSDNFGEFLARTVGSDSDEESEEEDDVEDGGLEKSEEYKFFLDVFVRDREMRDYYEKNWASGDFCCLVCGGAKKSGKKFKSCEALVQHSMSIAKTNRKQAHRALGLVICKVLGWDVNRLPAIVVKGEPLSRSLTSSVDIQGKFKETVDVEKDDAGAAHSGELQCENVEMADINKNVMGVADSNVEMVNVNHEFGDRDEGQALDDKQEHNKISIFERTVPEEVILSKCVKKPDEGNGDMGVNRGEWTDKMDALPSGGEWPCQKVIANPNSAIHERLDLPPDSSSLALLDEDVAKIAAEQNVLDACQDFFCLEYGSECDRSEADEDDNDVTDGDDCKDGESEESKFFIKLFMEHTKLRTYYEKCHGDGDFLCLVCAGVGKKTWRRFKGCTGLLHHSNTVRKAVKKAHRSYARTVCKVLGWDIDQLPKIVRISEPLSSSLAGSTTMMDSKLLHTSGARWPCEEIQDGSDPQTSEGQCIAGTQDSVPAPSSSAEWPCGDITGPESSQSEWPNLKLPSESVSSEEKEKIAAEQKVLEACRSFFRNKHGCELGEDEVDDAGGDLMDEDDEAEGVEEGDITDGDSEEFKFFIKLFTEDEKLRSFYENNHGNGDFCCLVCAAVSKKSWKRFKGCAGLLNHSNTVLKTMRNAHRAYAKAVCRILGWDIKQLPRIAPIAEPLSGSLSRSDGLQEELKADADGTIIDLESSESKENSLRSFPIFHTYGPPPDL